MSIRDIAAETGVSPSTVSRALRGIGRISPDMRDKIRAAAKKAGYHVHPLLAQALSLARQPKVSRYRETLALILEFDTASGPDYQKALHAGIESRAISLAYKLESFILSGKPAHHRQLSRVLRNRGIRGLIIMPRVAHRQPRLHMDWKHFAAVEIGRMLWDPRNLHRVETSEYSKTFEIVHLLKKVGYKRIGMAIEPMQNQHQFGVYYAAFLLMQHKFLKSHRVPIPALDGGWTEKNFCRWMKQYRPDVLIVHNAVEIFQWLQKLKLRIPGDVSIFRVGIREDDPPGPHRNYAWSGLRADQINQGCRAVEMVSHLLDRGEIGLVGNPMCWQVDGRWVSGATLSRPIDEHISKDGFLFTGIPRSHFKY